MKTAIFSLAYLPFVGGAELAVKEITERLPNQDFFCFTLRFDGKWPARERIGNVSVVRIGNETVANSYYGHFFKKISYIFRAWREAERQHRLRPFEAIWAIMASYAGAAALLFKLRHPQVPFLLTLQEGDSEAHILKRVNIFYPFWRLIFKKADYIQAISNYLADFAKRHGARCPIEVVPNGVDLESYNFNRTNRFGGPFIIITTSRLVLKNGIDVLIRAVVELKKVQSSKFKIQILGGGPDEQKLKKLTENLGAGDRIEFLGQIDSSEIPDRLSRADIFVRPSRSEGLGSSFLEAMAAGLPVIGTPVGGIPDFLRDRETGLFVKVNDFRDLAENMNVLMTDEKLRKRIAENGQKLIRENYSWDLIAEKINKFFKKLCVF